MKPEHIVFIPLDHPRLEFDREKLLEWYDSKKTRGYEEYVARIGYPWNVVWLRDEDRGTEWPEEIEEIFPNFFECVNTLPHSVLRKVYILEQVIDVAPHRDVSREENEYLGPSSYRCMLIDDTSRSLYYLKGIVVPKPEHNIIEEKHFAAFPEPRMWFVHNNHNSRHGAIMPVPPNRKLILCVWGNVSSFKHYDLLERSRVKYSDWAITHENSTV